MGTGAAIRMAHNMWFTAISHSRGLSGEAQQQQNKYFSFSSIRQPGQDHDASPAKTGQILALTTVGDGIDS